MAAEVKRRFPGRNIGGVLDDGPPDLVTGTYGIGILDRIFGRSLLFFPDRWPVPAGDNLTDDDVDALTVPDLACNAFFQGLLDQCDKIQQLTGSVRGFLNWQGVLNTAFRFRGQDVFSDMLVSPGRAQHLFHVVTETMIAAATMFLARQRACGVDYQFVTVANCTVNMAGPKLYEQFLLPCDLRIRSCFRDFGIHNCAWSVTPYLDLYARVPRLGYLDMGIESDLEKARRLFPKARRNLLYKSTDLKNRTDQEIHCDFERIARELAPCDVGLPDIETHVPDARVHFAMDLCESFSGNA